MKNMFKYYLSNKRRGISLIFVMALTVFSIYFVTSLVQSIFSTVEYSNIACLNDFSFVYPVGGSSFLSDETVEKIQKDDSVKKAYPILLEYTVINNIFGTTSGYVAFMDEADIGEIFDDYSLTVTEGRLPQENSYELIMHEDMLKNKGLSVGDTFGSAVDDGEPIEGTYTITGAFSGNSYMAFGTKSYKQKELEELGLDFKNTTFGLLVTPKTDLDAMNTMLDTMSHDEAAAMTLSYAQKTLKDNVSSIKFLMGVIVIVIAVSISAAVCIVLETTYNDRMEEFGILYAIGYKKSWLFRNIIAEIVVLVFISWILGLILSYGVLSLVAKSVFEPMGQMLSIVSIQSLLYTIIVMVVFVVVTILVTILKFAKKDLIAIIEMR
ncbi:MAG: FtsX-like permease family protein [Lachnospira sp.]|nr:ABC transporter permease [Eubacterium sp.]